MTALITLTTAGTDSGPFDLYSDVDGYTTAFETNVSKNALLGGYTSFVVPNGATNIRLLSTGACTNETDLAVNYPTTTTTTTMAPVTTTTTTTIFGTTTTTTTFGSVPFFVLDDEKYEPCDAQLAVTVYTRVPVKVNIRGFFEEGGTWLNPENLIFDGIKVSSNLIESSISTITKYTYGIGGFIADVNNFQNSAVTIQLIDDTTGVIIQEYTYYRAHSINQC